AAVARVTQRLNAPADIRAARFGDLIAIDLTKPTAIEAQADALPFPPALKLPSDYLQNLTSRPVENLVASGGPAEPTTTKLELRIHKVKCLDETDGFLGTEAGADEIAMGGTEVDETGDTRKIAPFDVLNAVDGNGKAISAFNDNDEKVYSPPSRFTAFN